MKDSVVKEVRDARERQSAKFKFDVRAIAADARRRELAGGYTVVSFVAGHVHRRKAG